MVISGSFEETWNKKQLEAAAESVYKLIKDLPGKDVAIVRQVRIEESKESKPK